MEFYKFLHNLL